MAEKKRKRPLGKPKAGGPKKSEKPKPRTRRTPEAARTELLDAAERVFSERGPDAAGLRDVAREAGVSHGLITHYFKTYEGLVEAVFARRTQRIGESVVTRLRETQRSPSAMDLVQVLIGIVSEPLHLRLVAWAMLTRRAQRADFITGREQVLRPIADAIHKAAADEATRRGTAAPSVDDVDFAVLLALGATYGWGLGKTPFLAGLGRKLTPRTDREVMSRLETMLQALLSPRA